jgi:hypothetical protein
MARENSGTEPVNDLRQALAQINAIRAQVARDTQFRGYGPVSIAASGVLALLVAAVQSRVIKDGRDFSTFLLIWVATAAVTVILTASEAVGRARRVHHGLAGEMIQLAAEQFLPAIMVGVLLTAVLIWAAPLELWMLPGLWELLFSLGVFASCRFLPRAMIVVAAWYLLAGLTCLILQSGSKTFAPWSMGIPFGVGQLLVAVVLQYGSERNVEDA